MAPSLLEGRLYLRVPRKVGFHPKAEPGVAERPSEGVPKKIAGHVGEKDGKHEAKDADRAEVYFKNNPETDESRDVTEEYCSDVDYEISRERVLSDELRDREYRIVHLMSISFRDFTSLFS